MRSQNCHGAIFRNFRLMCLNRSAVRHQQSVVDREVRTHMRTPPRCNIPQRFTCSGRSRSCLFESCTNTCPSTPLCERRHSWNLDSLVTRRLLRTAPSTALFTSVQNSPPAFESMWTWYTASRTDCESHLSGALAKGRGGRRNWGCSLDTF